MANEESYLDKYIKKIGYVREKLSNKDIPAIQKIRIIILFGDIDSTIMFSKSVYNNIIRKDDYYDIVISWNGMSSFFEKADEYWSLADDKIVDQLYKKTDGIQNNSESLFSLIRSLNEYFMNVNTANDYEKYYKTYLTSNFKETVKIINLKYSNIVSISYLGAIFTEYVSKETLKPKIALVPMKYFNFWENNQKQASIHDENVWISMIERLSNFFDIFVIQNAFTFDIAKKITSENVTIIKEQNFNKIVSMIYHTGAFFDFFNNLFSLGFLSQVFTFSVIDKPCWFQFRKYEDYELLADKFSYKNYSSFNYFTNFDNEVNQKFVTKVAAQCIKSYITVIKNEKKGLLTDKQFDVKNFCNRKLHYLRTNKIFFLRDSKNA